MFVPNRARIAFAVLYSILSGIQPGRADPPSKKRLVRMAVGTKGQTSLSSLAESLGSNKTTAAGMRREQDNAFSRYKAAFGRTYAENSDEHKMRQQLFHERIALIELQNAQSDAWRATVNRFTDMTVDELKPYRGYRKPWTQTSHITAGISAGATSLLDIGSKDLSVDGSLADANLDGESKSCALHGQDCRESATCCSELVCGMEGLCLQREQNMPQSKDWDFLMSSNEIPDQGSCGSCWAISAAATIQLQAARLLHGNSALETETALPNISPQGMLGCTPNPNDCGGTGGCDGATPELAFAWAKENGLGSMQQQRYKAQSWCPTAHEQPVARIGGFVQLTRNEELPVLHALYAVGPLAVAVAAGDWFLYDTGVFRCTSDLTVDHSVTMMGFGLDKKQPYWRIRNSWGPSWGENGFIRVARHPGNEPCGEDHDMQKGVACKRDPKVAKVCGECGLLSDVAYPIKTQLL